MSPSGALDESLRDVRERAKRQSIDRLCEQCGERRCASIIESHEAGWLQPKAARRTVVLRGEPRMHVRQQGQGTEQKKQSVQKSERGAEPPAGPVDAREQCKVEQGEQPAADHVQDESEDRCLAAIRCEHRADQKGQTEARQAQALAARQDRRHCHGRDQSPEHQTRYQVERHRSCSLRRSPRASDSAAKIAPTCVKACGKLPSWLPSSGSISSANNPRSFASEITCSNIFRAASTSPRQTRWSTAQNEQMPNAPSPGGRPSTSRSYLYSNPLRPSRSQMRS